MPKSIPIELPIGGGMWDAGDGAKAPDNTTRYQKNLIKRAGSLVKRPPFKKEFTFPNWDGQAFGNAVEEHRFIKGAGGSLGIAGLGAITPPGASGWATRFEYYSKQVDGGTYERQTPLQLEGPLRWSNGLASCVMGQNTLIGGHRIPVITYGPEGRNYGFQDPTKTRLPYGGTADLLAVYYGRLFMARLGVDAGSICGTWYRDPGDDRLVHGAGWYFYDTTAWTLVNATTALETLAPDVPPGGPWAYVEENRVRRLTTTAPNASIRYEPVLRYAGGKALDPWEGRSIAVRGWVDLAVEASTGVVPITLEIVKGDGSIVYGSAEYNLPSSSEDQGWSLRTVTGTVPNGEAFALRVKFYNSTGSAASGTVLKIYVKEPDAGRSRGAFMSYGEYDLPHPNLRSSPLASYYPPWTPAFWDSIITWSGTSDLTDWRSTAFYLLAEMPGPITALHAADTRLFAFKENGLWTFGYSTDPDIAIQLEQFHRNVGASNDRCVGTYKGRVYFCNRNGLYSYSPGSAPEQVAHDGIKTMAWSSYVPLYTWETIAPVMLAIDQTDGVIYLSDERRVWAFDIESESWAEVVVTDAGLSPQPVIHDIFFGRIGDEPKATLRLLVGQDVNDVSTLSVLRMSGSGTDDTRGLSDNINAEYWFHTIQTPSPIMDMMVETLELDHEITSADPADTFALSLSQDDGVTWTDLGSYHIDQIQSGGDTQVLSFPVWRSVRRPIFRLIHSGKGGEAAFNFNAARLIVQPLGRSRRPATPEKV
jgi:hypothetical protein